LDERRFENHVEWLNDPEVTQHLLLSDHPLARLAEREWFQRVSRPGESDVVFAIEALDGERPGGPGPHGMDHRHGIAHSGSSIGAKEAWGKGHGTDACLVRTRYVFQVLNLRTLFSCHLGGNGRSGRMLAQSGYREYGVAPQKYWKRGRYHDEHLLALERESWERQQQPT
jgi:RimJ/RimL family protein N-acetyltransferase